MDRKQSRAGVNKSDEIENFISLMDIEYCRFCGRSGLFLGRLEKADPDTERRNASGPGTSLLTTPCNCLRRHCRFAHKPCLITWIHKNLTDRCPDCQTTFNCLHRITPLREWRTDPSTDRMMPQYFAALLVGITIGVLHGIVIYLLFLTILHVALKVAFAILLVVMYGSGLAAGLSRCAIIYHKLYIFNNPVIDVIPPKNERSSTENILALL